MKGIDDVDADLVFAMHELLDRKAQTKLQIAERLGVTVHDVDAAIRVYRTFLSDDGPALINRRVGRRLHQLYSLSTDPAEVWAWGRERMADGTTRVLVTSRTVEAGLRFAGDDGPCAHELRKAKRRLETVLDDLEDARA